MVGFISRYYQVTLHPPQKFSDLEEACFEDGFYVNKTDAQDLMDLFIEILGHNGPGETPVEPQKLWILTPKYLGTNL